VFVLFYSGEELVRMFLSSLKKIMQPFKHWFISAEMKQGAVCSRESIGVTLHRCLRRRANTRKTTTSVTGSFFFSRSSSISVSLHISIFFL